MSRKPHPLTKRDVGLIQASFGKLSAHPAQLATRFYAHLFRLDPSLRRLFHGGMVEQGKKLMDMLTLVTARLDRLDLLMPTIRELGVRHAGYNVEPAHYATAREALLAAFPDVLGELLDDATRAAWGRAYDWLAETMIAATRDVESGRESPDLTS